MEQFGYFTLQREFSDLSGQVKRPEWPKVIPGVEEWAVEMFVELVRGGTNPHVHVRNKKKMVRIVERIVDFLDGPNVWTELEGGPGLFNVGLFMYDWGCGPYMLSDRYFWVLLAKTSCVNYGKIWASEQERIKQGFVEVLELPPGGINTTTDNSGSERLIMHTVTRLLESISGLAMSQDASKYNFYCIDRAFDDVFEDFVAATNIVSIRHTNRSVVLSELMVEFTLFRQRFASVGHLFASFDLIVRETALFKNVHLRIYKSVLNELCELTNHIIIPSRLNDSDARVAQYARLGTHFVLPGSNQIWAKRVSDIAFRAFNESINGKLEGVNVLLASIVLPWVCETHSAKLVECSDGTRDYYAG
jgi:hypothetical protein